MGRFRRLIGRDRKNGGSGVLRLGAEADHEHLKAFLRTRSGVEAFVEPRTTVTDTTVLLVADDGEWTRRRVAGPADAAAFSRDAAIPLYDPVVVGYPSRMRDYNVRRRSGD